MLRCNRRDAHTNISTSTRFDWADIAFHPTLAACWSAYLSGYKRRHESCRKSVLRIWRRVWVVHDHVTDVIVESVSPAASFQVAPSRINCSPSNAYLVVIRTHTLRDRHQRRFVVTINSVPTIRERSLSIIRMARATVSVFPYRHSTTMMRMRMRMLKTCSRMTA